MQFLPSLTTTQKTLLCLGAAVFTTGVNPQVTNANTLNIRLLENGVLTTQDQVSMTQGQLKAQLVEQLEKAATKSVEVTLNDNFGTPGTEDNKIAGRAHKSVNLRGNVFENHNQERSYGGRVMFYDSKTGALVMTTASHCVVGAEIPTTNSEQAAQLAKHELYLPMTISLGLDQNRISISELTNDTAFRVIKSKNSRPGKVDFVFVTNKAGEEWLKGYLINIKNNPSYSQQSLVNAVSNGHNANISTTRSNSLFDSRNQRNRSTANYIPSKVVMISEDGLAIHLVENKYLNYMVPGVSGSSGDLFNLPQAMSWISVFDNLQLKLEEDVDLMKKLVPGYETLSEEEIAEEIKSIRNRFFLAGSNLVTSEIASELLESLNSN
ncbi:MAG: hypothetical protein ACRCXZ_08615 [Patescibacteria group bacterium]